MIGVEGVAVVRREDEGIGGGAPEVLPVLAQSIQDTGKCIRQEGSFRALAAGGAHFLIVQHAPDLSGLRKGSGGQKSGQGGGSALQIVDPGS